MAQLLDIIVCTYEREALLQDCILSLSAQNATSEDWGVIVVNNSKSSLTKDTLSFLDKLAHLTVVNELEPGLSNARNNGIANSQATWLCFFDDDAKAPKDFVSKIIHNIKTEKWDCFGGHIQSWWKYGRPRWLNESYGSKPKLENAKTTLATDHNWGSNIIIKKSCLQDINGFPTHIGMKGHKLGYAAENIVQDKLREKGYIIGYDPNLTIDHVVMSQKLKLKWHIKSAYATGRDGRSVYPEQYTTIGILTSLKNCVSRPCKGLIKLITSTDYYWEHLVLDAGGSWSLLFGKLRSIF